MAALPETLESFSQLALDMDFTKILKSDDFKNFLEMIKYCGFDAETIKKVVNDYISSGDEEERRAEISKLIYLGMKRGNIISKILKTCDKKTSEWLKKIAVVLDLRDNIKNSAGENSNRTLTLSRLKKAFPKLSYDILENPSFKRRVSAVMIKKKLPEFEILPLIARDMCVMSLLPKKNTEDFDADLERIMIHHIFIYCFCESALLRSANNKKESEGVRAQDVVKYMNILWDASHISDEERNSCAKQMKEYFSTFGNEDMNKLRTQCDLIENFATKLDVNIPNCNSKE